MDLKDSGGLRCESNHYRTYDHQSNYWDHSVHGVPVHPGENHLINSNLAIATEEDKESIKSTSIYLGLVIHVAQFQGTICKKSRKTWKMSKKYIPSFCEQGRRKMAIDSSKCCLLWSLALNSCMILGYKVENIITALYFQCDLSYIWGRKSLYFHYIGLFFFSPSLFTIAADLGSIERTLHPVCCKALQYRQGFGGLLSSLAFSLLSEWAWDQLGPVCQLVSGRLEVPQNWPASR